ncbi:replication factor-A protein 1-related [Striga asiatica]|uniref:Replication factor-A protein 1-related n=1 Tax=Striga asiatica TaxID=4170 RepID=A0A5A7QLM0_STRAF|nr:replication factor-A protein 1-related [Striga asiatica]
MTAGTVSDSSNLYHLAPLVERFTHTAGKPPPPDRRRRFVARRSQPHHSIVTVSNANPSSSSATALHNLRPLARRLVCQAARRLTSVRKHVSSSPSAGSSAVAPPLPAISRHRRPSPAIVGGHPQPLSQLHINRDLSSHRRAGLRPVRPRHHHQPNRHRLHPPPPRLHPPPSTNSQTPAFSSDHFDFIYAGQNTSTNSVVDLSSPSSTVAGADLHNSPRS